MIEIAKIRRFLIVAAILFAGCSRSGESAKNALVAYNSHQDKEALSMAKASLHTSNDLPMRILLGQHYYMQYSKLGPTPELTNLRRLYAAQPREDATFQNEFSRKRLLVYSRYLLASIRLTIDGDAKSASALLAARCPGPSMDEKIRCHKVDADYFSRSGEYADSRDALEKAFIVNYVLGLSYQDEFFLGRAVEYATYADFDYTVTLMEQLHTKGLASTAVINDYCAALHNIEQNDRATAQEQKYHCRGV